MDDKALVTLDNQMIFRPSEINSMRFSETGLTVSGELSYSQWAGAVEQLADFENRSSMFFVWGWGDLIREGKTRFGEKYSQAMSKTGKAYQTLANYVWVAEHTERHLRAIPNLTLAHYLKVGKIKDEGVKAHLLLQASEKGWSAKTDLPREMEKLTRMLPPPPEYNQAESEEEEVGQLGLDELNGWGNSPPPATKDDQIFDLTVDNHRLSNEKQSAILQYSLITEKINEAIELIAPLLDRVELDVKDSLTQVIETLCAIPNGETIKLVNQAIDQYRNKQMVELVDTLDQLVERLEDAK